MSRGWALFVVIVSSVLLLLAVANMVLNFTRVASWLPLLLVMAFCLYTGVAALRARR